MKVRAFVVASGAVGLSMLFGPVGLPVVGAPGAAASSGVRLTAGQARLLSGGSAQALAQLGVSVKVRADRRGVRPAQVSGKALIGAEEAGGDDLSLGAAAGTSVGSTVVGPSVPSGPGNITPGADGACRVSLGSSVRVNIDCENAADPALHGRSQAQNETKIAVNPTNPKNVIASANDYRRGDGGCGAYFSTTGGRLWGGGLAPSGFTVPGVGQASLRQYWQAGGDTDVAFDSTGTAYLQCQVFNRGFPVTQDPDVSSGVLLFRSDNGGASWNFAGRPVVLNHDRYDPGAPGGGVVLEDKPFMAVDSNPASAFKDTIYVSWTEFRYDGTAPILVARSTDHGETFSAPILISTPSSLCPVSVIGSGNCDANQFSQPVVAADGTVYVVWSNFDNSVVGADNRNQVLVVKSTNGGASFGAVAKVTDYYDLPDCATYTGLNAGRSCVPVKGSAQTSFFRAANYPSAAADPTNAGRIAVTIGSYINPRSQEANGCTPAGLSGFGNNLFTGVTTAGACNNDILVSVTADAGASWSGAGVDPRAERTANVDATATDQWFQWAAYTSRGTLAVSFYDRQYGADEVTGDSDITVVSGSTQTRVTSSPMPPPTQFAGTFWGDYAGLATSGNVALPVWSDTRNVGVTSCPTDVRSLCSYGQDEDVFMARVPANS